MLNDGKKELSGFTLIELLVSIFIIVLVSGVFMVNYNNTNKRSELNMVKQKLASDIRVAQNNSLGAKAYNSVDTPKGGWGVHFTTADRSHYIIFADGGVVATDPNGNHIYDAGEAIETKTLPAGVTISSIKVKNNEDDEPVYTESLLVDIIFFPPDPVTYITGQDLTVLSKADARIELQESMNNSTAAVTVNFFGLIDTE